MTTRTSPEAAQARAARVAGAMYLVTMATSVVEYVRSSSVVRCDATKTAQNIMGADLKPNAPCSW